VPVSGAISFDHGQSRFPRCPRGGHQEWHSTRGQGRRRPRRIGLRGEPTFRWSTGPELSARRTTELCDSAIASKSRTDCSIGACCASSTPCWRHRQPDGYSTAITARPWVLRTGSAERWLRPSVTGRALRGGPSRRAIRRGSTREGPISPERYLAEIIENHPEETSP